MATQSSQWNNNTAFLLAATGSAVGLGNIWGFPYKAGENGGGSVSYTHLTLPTTPVV